MTGNYMIDGDNGSHPMSPYYSEESEEYDFENFYDDIDYELENEPENDE